MLQIILAAAGVCLVVSGYRGLKKVRYVVGANGAIDLAESVAAQFFLAAGCFIGFIAGFFINYPL